MPEEKPYNISIETQAQIAEPQKLLAELQSINAEIAKLNGLTFSGISASAAELAKTGKDLTEAVKAQSEAFGKLEKSSGNASEGIKKVANETENLKKKSRESENVLTGFYMELGAIGARYIARLPSILRSSIEAFGQQEMAVLKLTAAIRAHGGSVSEILPIMSPLPRKYSG